VCLGHQSIGAALGGKIVRAQVQMHGKASTHQHRRPRRLPGLPRQFSVIRYHSLAIERATCRPVLEVTSTPDDGEIMGVRHREPGRHRHAAGRRAVPPRVHPQRAWACHAEELPLTGRARPRLQEPPWHETDRPAQRHRHPPDAAMRAAMAAAEVGDDVFGDDPTVNALQERIAAMLGFEAALFVPSGTQSNLCALMSHCGAATSTSSARWRTPTAGRRRRGGARQHPAAAAAATGRRHAALADIEAAIKPDDAHFARTRLLALENTWGGQVLPLAYVQAATALARRRGLATHLDGARLFNAAVAGRRSSRAPLARRAPPLLRQRLGVLQQGPGRAGRLGAVRVADFIARAHRMRKMPAAACARPACWPPPPLHALDHHVDRLADDHANARSAWPKACRACPA
jgi:threonine aldolase